LPGSFAKLNTPEPALGVENTPLGVRSNWNLKMVSARAADPFVNTRRLVIASTTMEVCIVNGFGIPILGF
jgi:hypothetical protein